MVKYDARVWVNSKTDCYYVVSGAGSPNNPNDRYAGEFQTLEQAQAYADEMNRGRAGCDSNGQGQPVSPTSQTGTPGPVANPSGGVAIPRMAIAENPATPSAQGQAPSPFGQAQPAGINTFRMPTGEVVAVDTLPEYLAGKVDDAGSAFDAINSIVKSHISLVLGRCRLGIADCKQAVADVIGPIINDAKAARQLIVDTVSQHILNTMSGAAEATAPVARTLQAGKAAVDSLASFGGQTAANMPRVAAASSSNPWILYQLAANASGQVCYVVANESQPPPANSSVNGYFPTQAAAQSVADANNANTCVGGPGQQQSQPAAPIPSGPVVMGMTYRVKPFPGYNPPADPPGCPYKTSWLEYGVWYQLPGQFPRDASIDTSMVSQLPFPGYGVQGSVDLVKDPQSGFCRQVNPVFRQNLIVGPGGSFGLSVVPPGLYFGQFASIADSVAYMQAHPELCGVCNQSSSGGTNQPPTTTPIPLPIPSGPPSVQPPTATSPPAGSNPPSPLSNIPVNCCTIQPVGIEENYCDNIRQIRIMFINFGECWYENGTVNLTNLKAVSGTLAKTSTDLWKGWENEIKVISEHNLYRCAYDFMRTIASTYKFTNVDDYCHLLAVKRVFEWLESLTIEGSYNTVDENSGEFSIAPQIFGVGGGATFKTNWVGSQSAKAAIKAVIIPLMATLDKCIAYICPENIPSIQEAIQLYLTDQIDLSHCQCLVELNGGVWSEFKPLIQANRQRLDGFQTVQMWRRNLITETERDEALRGLGFIDQYDQIALVELTRFVPGPSDLIRFMMRDVEDPNVIVPFELDKEFTDKFIGLVEQQAGYQGIDRDTMLRYWRAHWQWPSNTQLYEMLHRLRPDNRPAGRTESDWDVTPDIVKHVLGINDEIPGFRQRLVDISYRPLTRIDARRAYNIGVLDRAGLISSLRDNGYDLQRAEELADFYQVLRRQGMRTNRYVKQYISGWIDATSLSESLRNDSVPDDVIAEAIEDANKEIVTNSRKACTTSLKKRYMLGEFGKSELEAALTASGMDAFQSQAFATAWDCERNSRPKQIAAGRLCKWVEDGLITPIDMGNRLLRLNYSPQDATLIVQECGIKIAEKQAKEAEALAKKTAAEQEKIRKAKEKLQKDLEKAKEKEKKARESIQKHLASVGNQFAKAAARYARIAGLDDSTAAARMQSAADYGHNSLALSPEDALELAIDLASQWKAKDTRDFATAYDELARSTINAIATLS